jgi:hypothetical protein
MATMVSPSFYFSKDVLAEQTRFELSDYYQKLKDGAFVGKLLETKDPEEEKFLHLHLDKLIIYQNDLSKRYFALALDEIKGNMSLDEVVAKVSKTARVHLVEYLPKLKAYEEELDRTKRRKYNILDYIEKIQKGKSVNQLVTTEASSDEEKLFLIENLSTLKTFEDDFNKQKLRTLYKKIVTGSTVAQLSSDPSEDIIFIKVNLTNLEACEKSLKPAGKSQPVKPLDMLKKLGGVEKLTANSQTSGLSLTPKTSVFQNQSGVQTQGGELLTQNGTGLSQSGTLNQIQSGIQKTQDILGNFNLTQGGTGLPLPSGIVALHKNEAILTKPSLVQSGIGLGGSYGGGLGGGHGTNLGTNHHSQVGTGLGPNFNNKVSLGPNHHSQVGTGHGPSFNNKVGTSLKHNYNSQVGTGSGPNFNNKVGTGLKPNYNSQVGTGLGPNHSNQVGLSLGSQAGMYQSQNIYGTYFNKNYSYYQNPNPNSYFPLSNAQTLDSLDNYSAMMKSKILINKAKNQPMPQSSTTLVQPVNVSATKEAFASIKQQAEDQKNFVQEIYLDRIHFQMFDNVICHSLGKFKDTLTILSLIDCGLTSLENLPDLPYLIKLDLTDNKIQGVELIKITKFKEINSLSLGGNPIHDYLELQYLYGLSQLAHLTLFGSPISEINGYQKQIFAMFPELYSLDNRDSQGNEIEYKKHDGGIPDLDD